MHLARCELVQCVVTLVALLDSPGLHIVRGASQPTSVLWPLAPCVDAAEIGDEATRTVTRSSWGATRRSSTPADFFCAYLVSFILRVCHSGMCRVRRLASLRYGLAEAGQPRGGRLIDLEQAGAATDDAERRGHGSSRGGPAAAWQEEHVEERHHPLLQCSSLSEYMYTYTFDA